MSGPVVTSSRIGLQGRQTGLQFCAGHAKNTGCQSRTKREHVWKVLEQLPWDAQTVNQLSDTNNSIERFIKALAAAVATDLAGSVVETQKDYGVQP
jgi:hypothetical protein